MLGSYNPSLYFNSNSTNPVQSHEAFYQEKQSGGNCSVHSLNAFAGRTIASPDRVMAVVQNLALENAPSLLGFGIGPDHTRSEVIQALAAFDVYPTSLAQNGADSQAMQIFMRTHKEELGIHRNAKVFLKEGNYNYVTKTFDAAFTDALSQIEGDDVDRIILDGLGKGHYIALRKDAGGNWRILDSETIGQRGGSTVSGRQPTFSKLKDAIEFVTRKYCAPVIRGHEEHYQAAAFAYTQSISKVSIDPEVSELLNMGEAKAVKREKEFNTQLKQLEKDLNVLTHADSMDVDAISETVSKIEELQDKVDTIKGLKPTLRLKQNMEVAERAWKHPNFKLRLHFGGTDLETISEKFEKIGKLEAELNRYERSLSAQGTSANGTIDLETECHTHGIICQLQQQINQLTTELNQLDTTI